jgi:anti-sigma B factor antagonist
MAELSDHDADPAITVTVHPDGASSVVRVSGDVDADTSPTLRAALTPLLQRPLPHTVIFDLSDVSFIDSAGLTVFVSVARDGRTVLLRRPSAVLLRLIDATGLTDLLPVEP